MGEVWEGVGPEGKVAVKIIPDFLSHDRGLVERLKREAEAAGRLVHPGIVRTLGAGEADGRGYIVMELLQGETLADRLARASPLPLEDLVRIAGELAEALAYVHAQGIVHRDLKPANIFLTEDGRTKLIDLGVAKILDEASLTVTGAHFGTPAYMAPESFVDSKSVTAAADVWSIGVLLYEAATGQLPFAGKTAATIIAKISDTNVTPQSPAHLRPDLPPHLAGAIGRCLDRDPARRASAADLAEAITGRKPSLSAASRGGGPAPSPPSLLAATLFFCVFVYTIATFVAVGGPVSKNFRVTLDPDAAFLGSQVRPPIFRAARWIAVRGERIAYGAVAFALVAWTLQALRRWRTGRTGIAETILAAIVGIGVAGELPPLSGVFSILRPDAAALSGSAIFVGFVTGLGWLFLRFVGPRLPTPARPGVARTFARAFASAQIPVAACALFSPFVLYLLNPELHRATPYVIRWHAGGYLLYLLGLGLADRSKSSFRRCIFRFFGALAAAGAALGLFLSIGPARLAYGEAHAGFLSAPPAVLWLLVALLELLLSERPKTRNAVLGPLEGAGRGLSLVALLAILADGVSTPISRAFRDSGTDLVSIGGFGFVAFLSLLLLFFSIYAIFGSRWPRPVHVGAFALAALLAPIFASIPAGMAVGYTSITSIAVGVQWGGASSETVPLRGNPRLSDAVAPTGTAGDGVPMLVVGALLPGDLVRWSDALGLHPFFTAPMQAPLKTQFLERARYHRTWGDTASAEAWSARAERGL